MYSQFLVSLCFRAEVFLFADKHYRPVAVLPEQCNTHSHQSGLSEMRSISSCYVFPKSLDKAPMLDNYDRLCG